MISVDTFSNELSKRIVAWEKLGIQEFADGSKKVGRISQAGSRAYLHTLMAPPADDAIVRAELDLRRGIPDILRAILRVSNGAYFFHTSLEVLGLPSAFTRDPEAPPQPHSLVQYNTYSRPSELGVEFFVCGGYGFNGGNILLNQSHEVFVCDREGARVNDVGTGLAEFLLSEFDRLAVLFDRDGKLIAPEELTIHPKLLRQH